MVKKERQETAKVINSDLKKQKERLQKRRAERRKKLNESRCGTELDGSMNSSVVSGV